MNITEARAAAFATKTILEATRKTLEEAQEAFELAATNHGGAVGRLNDAKLEERATARAALKADADPEYMARNAAKKNLKVYGWTHYRSECPATPNGGRQTREIMAAKSVAEVMRVTGLSRNYLTTYGGETGNTDELTHALSTPGVVFWRPLNAYGSEWTQAK